MRSWILLLTLLLVAADALSDAAQQELKVLQGEWRVVQIEARGLTHKFTDADETDVLEIKGNKWIVSGQQKCEIVALDPKTDPKCLDMKSVKEERKGRVAEYIYRIDGDTLTICWYQGNGKQRPTVFASSKEAQTVLIVLKRTYKE